MMPPIQTIDFGNNGEAFTASALDSAGGCFGAQDFERAQDGEWFPGFPDMLSPDDLASIFHVHKKTAQRMCKRGDLPAILIGRRWYVPKLRLIEFVSSKR